jgi:hypothetical protein
MTSPSYRSVSIAPENYGGKAAKLEPGVAVRLPALRDSPQRKTAASQAASRRL